MLIKSRRAKNSSRGIYLQDRQLNDTVFQPGSRFKYVIDVKNRKIVILSAGNEGNTVSKRELKNQVKPVLDIRNKEALKAFDGCEYLQVEIYKNQIIVSGYVSESETLVTKAKRLISSVTRKNVRDITDLLSVKKKAEIVLAKNDLVSAVGGIEQLSLSFDDLDVPVRSEAVSYIEEVLQHIHIPLQVDSLFSGAGLMDVGFLQAGFDVVFAVEQNLNAVKTYRENIGKHILQADITKMDKARFTSPVMIGGSPCQGFSNANRYTNYLDNPNNQLVRTYIESVKANKNCKVFVLENVPHLLTAGEGKFKDEILSELADFEIEYGVMNAANYGAPQDRKRAIMIGSKIGRIKLPTPTHQDKHITVREKLAGIKKNTPNQMDISKSNLLTRMRIKSVPAGGNVHDIPEAIRPKGVHSNLYKRINWDEPAITIVHPRKSMLLHPEEDRILSVRECARLQGLPDEFVFQGDLHARQQQVANGVPVPLIVAIAGVIHKAISMFNIRSRTRPAF